MAYAYPATIDLSQDVQTSSRGSISGLSGSELRKKMFDPASVILAEFKHKIEEDDHYITFFLERIRVEEQYIDNLTRLYDRAVAMDSLHDDASRRGQRSTSRKAWHEVRDYTQREVDARQAMVGALKEDVVGRLVAVKETQSRIRQRIREDMKHSSETYDDYAGVKLPRLKKAYFAKSQIVEDIRRQEHAIALQAKLLSTPNPSPTSPIGSPQKEYSSATAYPLSPPTHTPPLPPSSNPALHAAPGLADTVSFIPPSSSIPPPSTSSLTFNSPPPTNQSLNKITGNRNRAGSGSSHIETRSKEVLNDIAHQSKKGFNAFMQKLGGDRERDKDEMGGQMGDIEASGGASMAGMGGASGLSRRGTGGKDKGNSAMKGVRAKREADDADQAYRYGVFHLESLRIRRDKLQGSAITSLEQFNEDLNSALRLALERYIDTLHGTAATTAQATEVARAAIGQVNLDRDVSAFRAQLPSASAQILPVLYDNFHVGSCRSLIFGVSLADYDFARGVGGDHGRPPAIVEKCIAAIDQRGLDSEGIYRISGRHAGVQETVQRIEVDEEKFVFEEKDDVFSISNVLKQYLRQLPEPVFPLPHTERVKHTENRESHIHNDFSVLRGRLRRLPPIHQTTFQAIIEHLARVQMHSGTNKMDSKNLAVVFNTALFGPDQIPTDGNVLTMHLEKDTVLEDLITFSDLLFNDESPSSTTTSLPRGAANTRKTSGEGSQPGSSRTRVRILEPDPSAPEGVESSKLGRGLTESIRPDFVFTPDNELDLLFDPQFLSRTFVASVDPDYHVRPLSSTDFLRSHFALLSTLTSAPALAPTAYTQLFNSLRVPTSTARAMYYIVCIIHKATDQLVACGTLIFEQKFIHSGGKAGHIEDIVVDSKMQGLGLGGKLIKGLKDLAVALGCYKVILDCKEDKTAFYAKCGFTIRGRQMAYYVPESEMNTTQGITPSHQPLSEEHDTSLSEMRDSSLQPNIPRHPVSEAKRPNSQWTETDTESQLTYTSASSGEVTYTYPNEPDRSTPTN